MKFIYADSLDYVDPGFDFESDNFTKGRKPYWDDKFTHEMFEQLPYDGILVSRALLGVEGLSGKLTESQSMRFSRDGAKKFFRLEDEKFSDSLLFGDCGAFSYSKLKVPPYKPAEMVEFYEYGGFTHGCAIDHIIFEFSLDGQGSEDARERYDITLGLAEKFFAEHQLLSARFEPIGVAQGWSPKSLASSAEKLLEMGYRYIAIGGLVPLKMPAIRAAVQAVNEVVSKIEDAKIHLLGFAKAEGIKEFAQYRVASFDSSSPLIRAFKDNKKNYWIQSESGEMEYYSAIRVPQAHENNTLKNEIKRGNYRQEELVKAETNALKALRAYDKNQVGVDETLDQVMTYSRYLLATSSNSESILTSKLSRLRTEYERTLRDAPWKRCRCEICRQCSIEVIIFRASNRNKRRGMHNIYAFHNYTKQLGQ